jgi:hypothetical protein
MIHHIEFAPSEHDLRCLQIRRHLSSCEDDRPRVEVMIAGRPAAADRGSRFNDDIAVNEAAWIDLGLNELPGTHAARTNPWASFAMSNRHRRRNLVVGSTLVKDVRSRCSRLSRRRGRNYRLGLLSRFTFALDVPRASVADWPVPRE